VRRNIPASQEEQERTMSEKELATDETLAGKTAPKAQEKGDDRVLPWPSAATSYGGAYIPSQGIAGRDAAAKRE
jgi:hypothetical protein